MTYTNLPKLIAKRKARRAADRVARDIAAKRRRRARSSGDAYNDGQRAVFAAIYGG